MKFYAEQLVQRGHHYAIVDEVDSILIDEARTPLIISGASDESTDLYQKVDEVVRTLEKEKHYTVDEKGKTASLTDEGVLYVEEQLGIENLYDTANITAQHHVLQSLKAHTVFRRDVDYIVKDDQVVIVDEFTGRLMAGRRFSDGLHQALEAKEHVTVAAENQTLASITFQNYFRMYDKLSGMTGTADTEAVEFAQIYGLEVSTIPPNRPMVRKDMPDLIYRTRREKMQAIIQAIKELHATGQPVLVGTISIETSELISQLLKREGVPHSVLNAKHHAQESGRQGDHRHQHGGARYGHQAPGKASSNSAACTSSAPNATRAAVSTTSCAAVPAVRAIRAPRASICRSKTISCACSVPTAFPGSCRNSGCRKASPSRTTWFPAPSRMPRSAWKAITLKSVRPCWTMTTS